MARSFPNIFKMINSNSWGHGYFTEMTYPGYAFSELAPLWMDFACMTQGKSPGRFREGQPFRYLELGSGLGVGLCLLAAAYPEGAFVGVDLHPAHIAYSEWLVQELQLSNISFYEGNFLEMGAETPILPFDTCLRFNYIAAHGIVSWISPVVRDTLFRAVDYLLCPGGLFYCSYNTFPGWLERSAYKAIADLERRRSPGTEVLSAFRRASHTINRLLDQSQGVSALGMAMPRLTEQLRDIENTKNTGYLCGEFAHDYWQPFYVGDLHRLAAEHRLFFAASASLPENHPSLLPDYLSSVIAEESDPLMCQALLDLAINQSFRRDIFVRGVLPFSRTAQRGQLYLYRLRLIESSLSDPVESQQIHTTLGTFSDQAGHLTEIEGLLRDQPLSLVEIEQAIGIPLDNLLILVSLLLHSERIGLDRGDAGIQAIESCRIVNSRLMELMQGGHNLGYLAAPLVGHGALSFAGLDAFVLDGIRQGLQGEVLSGCVWMGMQAAGAQLRDPNGNLLSDPQDCLRLISEHINAFRSHALPRLARIGVVDEVF
jgi:SAM-dependent methyltransferase